MIESNNILNTDNSDGLSSHLKDLNENELAIPISSTHTSASAPQGASMGLPVPSSAFQ